MSLLYTIIIFIMDIIIIHNNYIHNGISLLYSIMIFITEVLSGLCKLTSKEVWSNSMQPYFFF